MSDRCRDGKQRALSEGRMPDQWFAVRSLGKPPAVLNTETFSVVPERGVYSHECCGCGSMSSGYWIPYSMVTTTRAFLSMVLLS